MCRSTFLGGGAPPTIINHGGPPAANFDALVVINRARGNVETLHALPTQPPLSSPAPGAAPCLQRQPLDPADHTASINEGKKPWTMAVHPWGSSLSLSQRELGLIPCFHSNGTIERRWGGRCWLCCCCPQYSRGKTKVRGYLEDPSTPPPTWRRRPPATCWSPSWPATQTHPPPLTTTTTALAATTGSVARRAGGRPPPWAEPDGRRGYQTRQR
jgi:hypothetical protein